MQPLPSKLVEFVTGAASQTGFSDSTWLTPKLPSLPPANSTVMNSAYAFLVISQVLENTVAALEQAKHQSSAWLSDVLLDAEKDGLLLDGYLLLILNQPPDATLVAKIREVELDSAICRKHVIWPIGDAEDAWRTRLRYVTVLGFPPSPSMAIQQAPQLNLPKEAEKALELYQIYNSFPKAAASIRERPYAD